jgi:hypothetical protein
VQKKVKRWIMVEMLEKRNFSPGKEIFATWPGASESKRNMTQITAHHRRRKFRPQIPSSATAT